MTSSRSSHEQATSSGEPSEIENPQGAERGAGGDKQADKSSKKGGI